MTRHLDDGPGLSEETREVATLDVTAFPEGAITPAWLTLLEDGLGNPIRVPLLVARGRKEGPVAGITAAVHGDELNGVPVIHRLFRSLDTATLRGAVVAAVVVNVPGFHGRRRRVEEGFDLNHLFPGRKQGSLGDVFAYRLRRELIKKLDLLLDLHTASRGRENTLYVRADMSDVRTARMAYLQRPQIIVHNPPSDGTLRGAAASLGIPAITVEIGDPQRFQARYVKRATTGVRAVLADHGMAPMRPVTMGDEPILCTASRWTFTDRGGLLDVAVELAEHVTKGQDVAFLHDVFGRPRGTFSSPIDGVVIGRATDPVASTGSRILHLGEVAPDDHPFVLHRAQVLSDEQAATPEAP